MVLLLLYLSLIPLVFAQNTVSTSDAIVTLNNAVEVYQVGNRSEAVRLFLSISMNTDIPEPVRQEARIYIGEILFIEGNPEDAKNMFLETLQTDPRYNIDRFRHPPEVCDFFDQVKTQQTVLPEPIEPPTLPKFPTAGYAPFGLYQIKYDKQWKGVTYSSLQTITGVGSLALFGYLVRNPSALDTDVDEQNRLNNIRRTQWASTALFYSLWAASVIDAQRNWQLSIRSPSQQDGATLIFNYKF